MGAVALRLLADRTGLTQQLSAELQRRSFAPVHDRGQVLVDVAVMLADGGAAIADIDVLRHQHEVLGSVASPPTAWRALDELTPAALRRIEQASARTRRHVWAQLPSLPASRVAGRDLGDTVALRADATLLTALLPKRIWQPALDGDGNAREGADVAELTGLFDLSNYPEGTRVIVRRERPHPGAQLSLFEERDAWRYQAIATNTTRGQLAFLEARHRAHARVEDRIRHAKDSGLGRFPSREFAINTAWCQTVALAADLVAWLRRLALTGGLALVEPKALRYRLLHVPARLVRTGRRRTGRRRILRLPRSWPWVNDLVTVFDRITGLPAPP